MFNSLYIHIPFCLSKCDYCVFYSTANHTTLQRKDFLECLKKEFEKHKSQCSHLKSLFIGGGTPSCLSTRELQELFKIIHSSFDFADSAEFTIESNPASLNLEKIKVLADNGINRISLGVQSFNPDIRTILGRKGDITMLDDLFNEFHKNDIKNINLDMIYAIPEQTCHDWEKDLRFAMQFPVKHLSAYSLSIEKNTPLAKRFNLSFSDDLSIKMWDVTEKILAESDINRYEISNYAKCDYECRHNMDIWHGDTYLGCGPSAVSFDGYIRSQNPANLDLWARGSNPEKDIVSKDKRAREIFAIGLRTVHGWDKNDFTEKTGYCLDFLRKELDILKEEKLLVETDTFIKPTQKGLLFADYIASEIVLP